MMNTLPISNLIQFIPGYLQNRGQADQGVPGICKEFIVNYDFKGLAHTELDEWNSDWNSQAEAMYRNSFGADQIKIMVVAYSWGCGFGFVQLAKYLRDRGLEITHAVLADPVYHWGPRWMHGIRIPGTETFIGLSQIKAYYPYFHCTRKLIKLHLLPPRPKIVVPDNVRHVDFFLQENSALHGHELKFESTTTTFNKRKDGRAGVEVMFRNHSNMDDCPEFIKAARDAATSLFQPPAISVPASHETLASPQR